MKILISAFDAFNNQQINPTQQIIENLPQKIDSVLIESILLPTVRYQSIKKLQDKIIETNPDFILMLGQASGLKGFHIERVAINIDDFRIKDNEGNQPIDEKISNHGKEAYFSTLPIKAITRNLANKGYIANISNSAGTFVCNHLFYGCAQFLDEKNMNIPFGFVHVCDLDANNSHNLSYSLKEMMDATITIIQTIVNADKDLSISGGLEY